MLRAEGQGEAGGPGRLGSPEPSSGELWERMAKAGYVQCLIGSALLFWFQVPFLFTLLLYDMESDFGLVSPGDDFGRAFECDINTIY